MNSKTTPQQGTWKLFSSYLRIYRLRLILVFCLVITVVTIDLAQPYLVKEAIDRYIAVADPNAAAIAWMAAVYLGLVLLSFGLTYEENVALNEVSK